MRAEAELVSRLAVERYNEGGNGEWQIFLGDVDHPEKGVMCFVQLLADFFISDDQPIAFHDLVEHRQRGVSRAGIRRAPVEGGDRSRFAQVRDVDNRKTAVPITDVEAITAANRMMAARRGAMPSCRFASGGPLARHPPAH